MVIAEDGQQAAMVLISLVGSDELRQDKCINPIVFTAAWAVNIPSPLGTFGLNAKYCVALAYEPGQQGAVIQFQADADFLDRIDLMLNCGRQNSASSQFCRGSPRRPGIE